MTQVPIDPEIRGDPPRRTVRADWNDVGAAAEVASNRVELALLSSDVKKGPAGREEWVFRYLASDDNEYIMTVQQSEPGSGEAASGPLTISAAGQDRRNQDVEKRLVSAMAHRLHQLAGVEWAPTGD